MGFADLSIADIAAEYNLPVTTVFHLCDQLGVTYRNQQTNLALEDAKAIIAHILSQKS
jgi:DNA-binding MurR/RpiR family transcriptional regulator